MGAGIPRGPHRRRKGPDPKRFVVGRRPTPLGDGSLWFVEYVPASHRTGVPDERYTTLLWNKDLEMVVDKLAKQGFDSTYWVISDERDGNDNTPEKSAH